MNTKMNIAVLGGDARYLEMIRHLTKNSKIQLVIAGFDQLNQGFTGAHQIDIEDIEPAKLDAVILPVPGIDDQGFIETTFSDQVIQLEQNWFDQLPKHCLIFSGIATPYLESAVKKANLTLIPLFNRDDVAIYNSIPTVEGTIMMAIQYTDFTLHSSNIIVLGLGRVGMTLASKLAGLGAHVYVGTRSSVDMARITEMGLKAFDLKELASYTPDCDILVNTIPAKVVGAEAIKPMQSHSLIIDLASKPGGTDFDYADKRGIKAIPALGLPGIVAPKTAGEILGNVISQVLGEKFEEGSK